jgi:ribosomal-protein-alanine N-acetyltransferase
MGGFLMSPTNTKLTLNTYIISGVRIVKDSIGVLLLRDWKSIEKEDIVIVNDEILPEITRVQNEGFEYNRRNGIRRFSKKLRKTFYVIKSQNEIVGYCIYYVKPDLSFYGIRKKAIIYSLAISKNFRRKGFAKRLLKETIKEMEINNISSIFLYVDVKNSPAINLYEKIGFQILREVEDICSEGELCHEMELKLH